MRKMGKRFLCMVLIGVMLMSTGVATQAAEIGNSENTEVKEAVQQFQKDFPNSDISVIDGEVHIVLSENDVPQTRTVGYNCPEGGSFVNFQVGSYEIYRPYAQVYMNTDAVKMELLKMSQPNVFQDVLDCIAQGYAVSTIIYLAKAVHGVTLSVGMVSVAVCLLAYVVWNLDYTLLNQAMEQSADKKAYVVYGYYSNGTPFTMYGPWTGSTCTSFMNFNAEWRPGEYKI